MRKVFFITQRGLVYNEESELSDEINFYWEHVHPFRGDVWWNRGVCKFYNKEWKMLNMLPSFKLEK